MLCCISGITPRDPVVSKKTGHLFDRRLIVKFLQEHGKCPITGTPLNVEEDLLPVISKIRAPEPRSPGSVSVPRMLEMFQNEWDTLMLETFTTRKHLDTVRKELSHSLYQHEAAQRVIARFVEQSRKGGSPTQMPQTAMTALKSQIIDNIKSCAQNLSAQRKKRKVSPSLAKTQGISSYREIGSYSPHPPTSHPTCLDIHHARDPNLILSGGSDGSVVVYNKQKKAPGKVFRAHQNGITKVSFHRSQSELLLTSSLDGTVKIWKSGEVNVPRVNIRDTQKGPITDFSVHPTGDYLVSSCVDYTWGFFDLETGYCLNIHKNQKNHKYQSIEFHPDGLILATGSHNGVVEVWETKSQKSITNVKKHEGAIVGVAYSENGYIMATGSTDGVVNIWDLRRFSTVQTFRFNEPVADVAFDFSGVYLGVCAGRDVVVHQSKVWKMLKKVSGPTDVVTSCRFGKDAKFFVSASKDKNLRVYAK